ncbi:MAG: (d)CMP kinase [Clostridia bacterium]
MSIINVAIDGPAGAGKSSIAKAAARELGLTYIDTGAMYRTVGLAAVNRGIDLDDGAALEKMTDSLDMKIEYIDGAQHIFLDDRDVSEDIRRPEISMAASRVSAYGGVRSAMVRLQRDMAKKQSVIMDGRDICMYVLPDADVKIYLTASVEARAKRRLAELLEKGEKVTFDQVRDDMEKRDYADMHRENSPLRQAPDARLIDTSDLNLEQSVEAVISYIKEKTGNDI